MFMSSLMFLYLKKLSQSLRFVSNQYSAKADTHTFMSLTQDSLTHSLLCINKLKYDSVSQCMLLYLPSAPSLLCCSICATTESAFSFIADG